MNTHRIYHLRRREPRAPVILWALTIAALSFLCLMVGGCALNRPLIQETVMTTNGVTTSRMMKSTTIALWPATSELVKQKLSAGKTLSVGTDGLSETAGATTNDVQILNSLRAILGR
jgi:hypothetical protein